MLITPFFYLSASIIPLSGGNAQYREADGRQLRVNKA